MFQSAKESLCLNLCIKERQMETKVYLIANFSFSMKERAQTCNCTCKLKVYPNGGGRQIRRRGSNKGEYSTISVERETKTNERMR